MNQLPTVPALGLTVSIPKERVQQGLEAQIHKGSKLIAAPATTPEIMAQLKKANWDWTLETSNLLKEWFVSESVAAHFNANVYFEPSLKVDDFQRDLDEFPHIVRGRIDRLLGLHKVAVVIPEPPCGDFIAAQFHPAIYHATWKPYERAQYGQAINLAVQEVEDAIKLATSGSIQETGVALVRKAFDPEGGPLLDAEYSATDNQGVADLLAGFFGRYKGMSPNTVLDPKQVARVLSLASYLMYIMDLRKPKKEDKPAESEFEFEFLKPD
ncbi:MAG: TIGR02391 family protein [Candidatus Melainabacteria bacterium]|nr:TIGR02391 family protein [Candidatus Melainabacteria bacterium]